MTFYKAIVYLRIFSHQTCQLTNNGHGDHYKVDDVKAVFEVVLSERDDLQKELYEEDDDEGEVDEEQDDFFLQALLVRLHHQSHHVQADQHHHEDFKTRSGHQVKEQRLAAILRRQKKVRWNVETTHTLF